MKTLSPGDLAQLQSRLRWWYARNKRTMPWRGTRDPYRVWLSEVMLQQTRVAAVVDYYGRFLKRFPTVRALARARSDEVMRLWAGLGYYSRARNLHAAAKQIVRDHGGKFPHDHEAIRALPGVGAYTAAAVASIAFGLSHAVLDGNVARVLARLFAIRGDLRAPRRWKHLQALAQSLLPVGASFRWPAPENGRAKARPYKAASGDWNQAMMELGATLCTPRAPNCAACPVSRFCRAQALGIEGAIPQVRTKRAPVDVSLAALVLLDPRGRTLLVREQNEYFSRMWQFPAATIKNAGRATALALAQTFAKNVAGAAAISATSRVRHAVTFRNLTIHPYVLRASRLTATPPSRLIPLAKLNSLAASSATRKVAAAAQQHIAGRNRGGIP